MHIGHQRSDGGAPNVAGAEQLGNPEPPVRIPLVVYLDQPVLELRPIVDKQPAQTAAQQGEELTRLNRRRREVGRSDKANIADVTPAGGD